MKIFFFNRKLNRTMLFLTVIFFILQNVNAQSMPIGGICDGADNRVSTVNRAIGRLYGGNGGTAWITPSGLLVTAGHCASNTFVEFNVPPSIDENGQNIGVVRRSADRDRYQIKEWLSSTGDPGVGHEDWAVFSVYPNSETDLYPIQEQGECLTPVLASSVVLSELRGTGYGADGPAPNFGGTVNYNSANQTLQTALGSNVMTTSDNILYFQMDVQHGESGGPIFDESTGKVIGIFTHAACNLENGNARGTKIFQAILDAIYPVTITLDQKTESGNRMTSTTIGRWLNNSFNGISIGFDPPTMGTSAATVEVLRAKQDLYGNEKYSRWQINFEDDPDIKNHHLFEMTSEMTNLTSQFRSAHNASIKAQLAETGETGGTLGFKDPWRIDYDDPYYGYNYRNQGMDAGYYNIPSATNNIARGTANNGVFPNQVYDPLHPQTPYYSIRAPLLQTIANKPSYFINWSTPTNATLTQVGTNPTGYDQKAVVFTNSDAVVTANYKASFATNNTAAIANSGQRKVVRTFEPNTLHLVYESMGYIWYETSTDDGGTWTLMNNNQPISAYGAKQPSIARVSNSSGAKAILITYHEGNSVKVKVFAKPYLGTQYSYLCEATDIASNLSGITDANPVIATTISPGGSDMVMVVWEGRVPSGLTTVKGLRYWSTTLDMVNFSYTSFSTANTVNGVISNATTASSHPTLEAAFSFHLAWQESNTSIKYKSITYGLTQNTTYDVSDGDGYTYNYSPSIIAVNSTNTARISWVGKRVEGGEEEFSKSAVDGEWKYRTLFTATDEQYFTYWAFGDEVNSTNITINTSQAGYIVAWSKSNGANQYTRSSSLGGSIIDFKISTTPINGRDVQVIPGSSFSDMYGIMLNTQNSPYQFKRSDDIGVLGKEQSSTEIFSGREGVVFNGDAQFFFTIGDVTVDDTHIEFEEKPDSVIASSKELVNQYLISKPFTLNNQSSFSYGVVYGITDSAACSNLLDNGQVGFKVQLINDQTGAIIGEFDNVSYNKFNVYQYQNIGYQVNTNGIGNVTARLRLVVESTVDAQYRLGNKYNTESLTALGKSNGKKKLIGYQGNLTVKSYALEQNFPNPFNPTTTINYALPKAGNVVLKVFDILGKEVATLVNNYKEMGRYQVEFDASKLSSGMYIYKLTSDKFTEVKKMMLVK